MANAPAQVGPGQGARTDIQHSDDVRKLSNTGGNSSDYLASRIKRDRPDIAEAVERDQLKWSKSMAGRMLAIARNDRLAEVDPGLLPPSWSILFALTSKAIAGDAAPSLALAGACRAPRPARRYRRSYPQTSRPSERCRHASSLGPRVYVSPNERSTEWNASARVMQPQQVLKSTTPSGEAPRARMRPATSVTVTDLKPSGGSCRS